MSTAAEKIVAARQWWNSRSEWQRKAGYYPEMIHVRNLLEILEGEKEEVPWGEVAAVVGAGMAHRLKDEGFTFTRRKA